MKRLALRLWVSVVILASMNGMAQRFAPRHRPRVIMPPPVIFAPVPVQPVVVGNVPTQPVVVAPAAAPAASPLLLHGPWLTYPDTEAMTIGFVTAPLCGGGVEFREAGTEMWYQLWHANAGKLVRHRQQHSVRLFGLKPNTEYEYRLVIAPPLTRTLDHTLFNQKDPTVMVQRMERISSPDYHFHTFSDQPTLYTLSVTADLQFPAAVKERILRNYYSNGGMGASHLFAVLGDGDNVFDNFEYSYMKTLVDKIVQLGGSHRPSLFIRGNHEWRGMESDLWCDYFAAPDTNSTYFSFRCGEVYYIVLETGEDCPPYLMTEHFSGDNVAEAQLFAEQNYWLQSVVASEPFQTAKFRVVLSHTAIYSHAEKHMHDTVAQICGDLFKKQFPQNKIHLWISGHTHCYCRTIPGASMVYQLDVPKYALYSGEDYTFPCVTLDGPGGGGIENTLLNMSVEPDRLSVIVKDEAGQAIDAFAVLQDGAILDLNNNTLPAKQVGVTYHP